ncbi:MFS transporter [Vibrio sp. D404a]|uniref:MFS transporter n=1 Tax=unclassified Vibrio TaxID=2614977 RepID=UPI00255579A3|nr:MULTISPECIES: MFS transporter [unclassified Vibrio]MDK9738141.1 MFS transporter [Vibrio sp. D404a]MDK9796432.1 MFS transporter [Vibrio sp. D449a]
MNLPVVNASLWSNRDYVRLLLAQVVSLIGTGISSVCLALLAYELAESEASTVLSIAFALKMLAYIGLAPIFAVLSRRWPKKRTLIILDLLRALLFMALPFVDQVWQVYVLMFAINACSAAFTPLFQATLPQIVPIREHYTKALSYSRIAYDLEQVLSPVLSAVLLTVVSFRHLFWADAVTFIISAVLVLLCFIPSDKGQQEQTSKLCWKTIFSGITAYLAHSSLRSLWYAYLAAAAASAMVIVNTVVYVHDILHGGDSETALAMLAVGIGSMLAAIFLPKLLNRYSPQRYHIRGLILIWLAFYAGTWLPDWFGFIVLCFSLGIGMSCIQTTSGIVINDAAGSDDAGQYFAAHFSLTHFWWLLTYLAAGLSATYLGMSGAYWVMFTVASLSGGIYLIQVVRSRAIA